MRHGIDGLKAPRSLGNPIVGGRLKAAQLGPREFGFVYPSMQAPVMRGVLRIDEARGAVEVTGRLNCGLWAIFTLGMTLAGIPGATVFVVLLAGWAYWGERERFEAVLADAVAAK